MRLLVIDAFTQRPFAGNPAAVCFLDRSRTDTWMQSVAAEMNLSETAFLLPERDGWRLRWFTPVAEVDLCGHATLASAHALWDEQEIADARFWTNSGTLVTSRRDGRIEMDFPALPSEPTEAPAGLEAALGVTPVAVALSRFDYLVEVESLDVLRGMRPDFVRLASTDARGVMVTCADGVEYDFQSRYFAPGVGVDEDPVTGSAHCCLATYWADRLGRTELTAFQASKRGGVVRVRLQGDRVVLCGEAVTVMRGELDG